MRPAISTIAAGLSLKSSTKPAAKEALQEHKEIVAALVRPRGEDAE